MTQIEFAKKNVFTGLMKRVARDEGVYQQELLKNIREGKVVLLKNRMRDLERPCGIGKGLRTKINANIGTSTDKADIKEELKKLETALGYKADTVMDLSVGGDLRKIRKAVLERSTVPVGTVPVYEIAVHAQKKNKNFLKFAVREVLDTLESQAADGVDFFTIHAGVNRKSLESLKKNKRTLGIVSRGGAILASWIKYHKRDNPFYEYFDKVLDIAYRYDVAISLGDGLRPGSVLDATDGAQLAELKILGELCLRARKRNVQVMIEGPGHVPLDQIKKNIILEKKLCHGAPFYVLGPLVTDVAPGYDHITSSIGGALAASYGADFLCYVTPSEHLGLPGVEDVRDGVIAARIAAHAADLAKGLRSAYEWDKKMSLARRKRDWKRQIKLSIDPGKASALRSASKSRLKDACTMCGRYCSIKLSEECLGVRV